MAVATESAAAVIVSEVKPMQVADIRPYNGLIHEYLMSCGESGYGCRTQMRMEFLSTDGYHVNPRYDSIRDRTYACAFVGFHVPEPVGADTFIPGFIRRRWETNWPRLVSKAREGTDVS